jgi:two-component system CheB/CheR fusion protein
MSETSETDAQDGGERQRPETEEDFPVVGIGASAGGIKALQDFFANVPADSGMAYVVILHMSPEHESRLAEVLQNTAAIPVTQVRERVLVRPDHVYVIPPNKSLKITDEHLALSQFTRIEERRSPVDIFFRTLAEAKDSRAVCVILSGTGADGSLGLKHIKENGGVAFVQDPEEAEYSDMPRNSVATGLVDGVLPVTEIPAKIAAYRKHLRSIRIPEEPLKAHDTDALSLRDILTQLRVRTGHDFSNYKLTTVLRRIERRLGITELPNLHAYAAYMHQHPEEASALLKDLLISVTNFFRNREAFEALERDVVPKLVTGRTERPEVRVWVAGCATGEEAYSLAMLLSEYVGRSASGLAIQVFATDIDERAIALAREGLYTDTDVADVSLERLRQFFIKEPGGYRVKRALREMVLFAVHNVIKDPPFSHLNLVSCRNLLIYLNRTAQKRLMEVVHFALNPGGYLFLGASESTDGAGDIYVVVDKEHNIFQSRAVASRLTLPIPDRSRPIQVEQLRPEERSEKARALERISYADLHQRLLERYAPPSVVVNEEYDIVHMSERAGRYMQLAGGEPSHNLLHIVRPELRLELRTALYQAVRERTNITSHRLSVRINDRTHLLNLTIRPVLREEDQTRGFILVVFEETGETVEETTTKEAASLAEPVARQLEGELIRIKAQLRATIEQYEIQHEELRASNEELQATNEELHSAAEELETSTEELQSVNEELTTVNQELKIKIEELSQANNDLRNLMNSTEIGTIFLDRSLRVKLFTPPATEIFNFIPADAGRPLLDITNNLAYTDLRADIESVIDKLHTVEREVETSSRRWFLMRLLPYRTSDDRINGVVITFQDITERKRSEEELRQIEERLRLLMESVTDYAIFIMDTEGRIEIWNPGSERMFGYTSTEAIGQPAAIIYTPEDCEQGVPEAEMRRAREDGRAADERWHLHKDGTRFYVSGVMAALRDEGVLIGFAKIARDLTERMRAEEALQLAHEELEERVRERTRELAQANTALRGEIAERTLSEKARVQLLRRIVRAQEDERRRISREIHDQMGQQLTALRLNLGSLKEMCGDDKELCEQVERTQTLAEKLDANVDFFAWELRPSALDDLGLVATLANFTQEWSKHFDIAAEFHSTGFNVTRLAPEAETNLYRITQEALNNISKHAQATRANVIFERRDHHAVLIIEDNGIGFDHLAVVDKSKGLGLIGMRERAALVGGTLEIESATGQGSTLFVRVPLAFIGEEEES